MNLAEGSSKPAEKERILVVDDEESIREVVCSMLTAAVYRCAEASSGAQAVRLLAAGAEFELMLSDMMMAEMDGYDGSGYPRGLKGEEIPLGARIFAIADTLDAITSDRPYRAAQSFQAARDEIVRWAGRQFDPEIAKIFLSIPPNAWCQLREEINRDLARSSPFHLQPGQYSGVEVQSTSG